jgi:hypothetical protein
MASTGSWHVERVSPPKELLGIMHLREWRGKSATAWPAVVGALMLMLTLTLTLTLTLMVVLRADARMPRSASSWGSKVGRLSQ